MLEKTGLTVEKHINRTVDNFLKLRKLGTPVHVIPVLQGWELDDYKDCFERFEAKGVDLRAEPLVGLGSVCRRQGAEEIGRIVKCFHAKGLKLHGFGVKMNGLNLYRDYLESADSLAWSFGARYRKEYCSKCEGISTKPSCNNCLNYALEWRERLLRGA